MTDREMQTSARTSRESIKSSAVIVARVESIAKTFSDIRRLRLRGYLRFGERAIRELAWSTGWKPQSTRARLRYLCRAGMVIARDADGDVYYRLARAAGGFREAVIEMLRGEQPDNTTVSSAKAANPRSSPLRSTQEDSV